MPLQRSLVRARLPVESLAGELGGKMQRGGSAGKSDGILHADALCDLLLHFVDVRADGGDPVCKDRVIHPMLFRAVMHSR